METRMAEITKDNSSSAKIVVAFTAYAWNHALVVLRIVGPLQQAGLRLIHGNELDQVYPERVSLGDVVLIQRDFPRFTQQYQEILTRARAEGKPVIYEIDDLLLELPEEHPDRPIYYYTPALFPMLRALVEADAVTTTTPALLAYLRPFNEHAYLLPNFLDDRLWTFKSPLVIDHPSPVVLGYMGSTSHKPDLEQILPVLIQLADRYKENLILRFWGGEPPTEIKDRHNVEWVPISLPDYPKFVSEFSKQESDIFIAPLKDTFFNQCKSPIKYLEYSAMAVPGVYSNILPYQEVVHHAENGFLAGTTAEWETHLRELIESPELRHTMGLKAQQSVRDKWLLSQNASLWANFYNNPILYSSPTQEQKQQQVGVVLRVSHEVQGWQEKLEQSLREKENELSEIKSSTAWRMVQALWGIRRKINPKSWGR
jgi:glycosyltransferase involved in cell wall biosynthesis